MKKLFFISALAFAGMAVGVAQTQYKFEKGDISTELQFSLLNLNIINYWGGAGIENTGHFMMPGLRVRYAITDKWVVRTTLGLDFGHNSDKRDLSDDNNPNSIKSGSTTSKNNYTNFSILPGIEYHFGKWERMSIYVGGELLFGINATKSTYDYNSTIFNYNYDGTLYTKVEEKFDLTAKNCDYYVSSWGDVLLNSPNGHMAFGINAFTGIDFYVYKGLYLGAELGLGYDFRTSLKGKIEGTYKGTITYQNGSVFELNPQKNKIDLEYKDKTSSGNFAFKCNPMIRLGWKF